MQLFKDKTFRILFLFLLLYFWVMSSRYFSDDTDQKTPLKDVGEVVLETPQKKEERFSLNNVFEKLKESKSGEKIIGNVVSNAIKEELVNGDLFILSARKTGRIIYSDLVKGAGDNVLHCGSTAKIHYSAFLTSGIKIESTYDAKKPVSVDIGDGAVMQALESALVGMRLGSSRRVIIPKPHINGYSFLDGLDLPVKDVLYFDVNLLDIHNGLAVSNFPLKIKNLNYGSDDIVLCGSQITIKYSLTDIKGNTLSGNTSLFARFSVGDGTMPLGLEQGIILMGVGGKRLITVPSEWFDTLSKSALPENVRLPKDESVVFDVELVDLR